MTAIVTVKDKRTITGYNIRSKDFATVKECIKWVRHFNNTATNSFLLMDDGVITRHPIYTTAAWTRKKQKELGY